MKKQPIARNNRLVVDRSTFALPTVQRTRKDKATSLKELNDKIAVLLETPEELEAEILDAEELDSLIVEKVCLTDNLIELAKRNLNQHVLSHSPENISTPSSSPQKGQTNQQPIHLRRKRNKKINNPIPHLRLERQVAIFKVTQSLQARILQLHRRLLQLHHCQ